MPRIPVCSGCTRPGSTGVYRDVPRRGLGAGATDRAVEQFDAAPCEATADPLFQLVSGRPPEMLLVVAASGHENVAAIADAGAARGIWVIVDLCYERLIYEAVPHNLPRILFDRLRDRTVIAGSASKAYAMTGWRCGWTIAPKELTAAFNVIQGQSTSNITSITQKAALAAITGSQDPVTAMLDEYRRRRDSIHAWLTANPGIQCVKPSGAFYLFPDFSEFLSPDGIRTTSELAQALLDDARVAVTPGEAFDAPGFVRLSYATSMADLKRGTAKILEYLHALEAKNAPARA